MPGSALWLLLLGCLGPKAEPGDTAMVDADRDGYTTSADCDDADPAVFPGAPETCDGRDEDCDGTVDEDASDAPALYVDADGDGYGGESAGVPNCSVPEGMSDLSGDCDDGDAAIRPAVAETCDGVDNNCDGTADEDDATDAPTWFADRDGDGFGDLASAEAACAVPAGYTADATDCDDADPDIRPGVTETCDGADNDCDGTVDEDEAADTASWYADTDADGFGDVAVTLAACDAPAGYTDDDTDCDDADPEIRPTATETCDGEDDDCDGTVDEDDASDALTWYADRDADGYGSPDDTVAACSPPLGFGADSSDCDDTDPASNPAGAEACGGGDEDCDGAVDEDGAAGATPWYADGDADGYGDASASTEHCAAPVGSVSDATDCDDGDATVNPGATEVCRNEVDDDCDGTATGCTLASADVVDADVAVVGGWYFSVMGHGVAGIGDSDGDGCADVLSNAWARGGTDPATAYLYSGCGLSGTLGFGDAVATIETYGTGGGFGQGGDLDGDGLGDAVLEADYSAPSYIEVVGVYRGPMAGPYSVADADFSLTLEEPYTYVGGLTALPDIDGDGLDDLLVGCTNAARAYLVYGASLADMSLADADAIYDAEPGGAAVGEGVAAAGDVNADGYGDFWIAAASGGPSGDGAAYLVLGPAGVDLGLESADAALYGDGTEGLGPQMSGGDVDGDGHADVVVRNRDIGARLAYGPLSGTAVLSATGVLLRGDPGDLELHGVVTSDVDGNGTADILVSTEGPAGASDGQVFLFTTAPTADVPLTDADAVFVGDRYADAHVLADPGDVNGDGYGDVMIGAYWSSFGSVEAGATFLFFGTGL